MRTVVKKLLRNRNGTTAVIIYGTHSSDWMEALVPDAPIWNRIRSSRALLVEHISEEKISGSHISAHRSVVIPLMEDHIAACLRNCPKSYALLLPSERALSIFRDKGRFAAYAKSQSLSHLCPHTYQANETVLFPCVLKRTDLNAGAGIAIATSPSHLQELLQQDWWRQQPTILQQYISGHYEYVAHCVCRNGKILWQCVYEYESTPGSLIRNGTKQIKRAAINRRQFKQIESFLRPLKYTGPCNVDFKLSAHGDIIVFEINPRLGGSLMRPVNIGDLQLALTCIIDVAQPQRKKAGFINDSALPAFEGSIKYTLP